MFRCLTALSLAASFAGAAVSLPAHAQQAPATVEMAFNPPLGTTLRFRVTKERDDNREIGALSIYQELRFERNGDGFTLYWRIDDKSLPPPFRDPVMGRFLTAMLSPFTGQPIAFDLDAEGTPLRVRDWEQQRVRMKAAILSFQEQAGAFSPEEAERLRSTAAGFERMWTGLSDEEAAPILLADMQQGLGWGGLSMRVGETHSGLEDHVVPLIDMPVATVIRVTLTAFEPGRSISLTIERGIAVPAFDADDIGKGELPQPSTDAPTAADDDALVDPAGAGEVRTTTHIRFDPATGLPLRAETLQTVEGDSTQRRTRLVEWLR